MPLADPNKSFEVSARHLFRHLGDAIALRRNPLVRALFLGSGQPKSDRFHLVEVRERILEAAQECLHEDIAAGRRRKGERSYKIVVALCNGIDPENTACNLNLSSRQYYRDRKDISRRVARRLVKTVASRAIHTNASDAFDLLIARATALVEEGCASASVAMIERALPGIDEAQGKIIALLKMSSAYVQYGNVPRARECLEAAKDVQNRDCGARASGELLDLISLTEVDVALAGGSDRCAPEMLDSIIARSQQTHPNAPQSRELVLLEALLEKCSFDALNGRFHDARRILVDASAVAMKLSAIPSKLAVLSAVMAGTCREDSSVSPDETLTLYAHALRLSISANSARGAFYALNGQMRAFLRLGEEKLAYQRFFEAVKVARSMEGNKFLASAAVAGTSLVDTKLWPDVARLVLETQALVQPNSLKSARLICAQGALLSRMGKPREALEALTAATELLARLQNNRYHSNSLREHALALHRMGQTREAKTSISMAIELAKENADALSLRQTYSVAAGVLDNQQFSALTKRVDRQGKRYSTTRASVVYGAGKP